MVMDFLKSFKKKKNEFNKEYINVCVFIDKIHNEETPTLEMVSNYYVI